MNAADASGVTSNRDEVLWRGAKALGHPVRLRIIQILLARDTCMCGGLVEELPVAQATVSQHLKVLKEAGLVRGEIDGPRIRYCADRDALRALGAAFGNLTGDLG